MVDFLAIRLLDEFHLTTCIYGFTLINIIYNCPYLKPYMHVALYYYYYYYYFERQLLDQSTRRPRPQNILHQR
jgi:hypothetical protein